MTGMEPLTGPRGLNVPRVYASTDQPIPHLVLGCICGWTRDLPDGCLSVKVTLAATRHMMTAHLGQSADLASEAAEAAIDALDDATAAGGGR